MFSVLFAINIFVPPILAIKDYKPENYVSKARFFLIAFVNILCYFSISVTYSVLCLIFVDEWFISLFYILHVILSLLLFVMFFDTWMWQIRSLIPSEEREGRTFIAL